MFICVDNIGRPRPQVWRRSSRWSDSMCAHPKVVWWTAERLYNWSVIFYNNNVFVSLTRRPNCSCIHQHLNGESSTCTIIVMRLFFDFVCTRVFAAGMGDMAVSNSIGSNIFDVLLGLGFPWALRTLIVSYGSVVSYDVIQQNWGTSFSRITICSDGKKNNRTNGYRNNNRIEKTTL